MAGTRLKMWTLKPTVDGWVVEGYRQPDDDYWHSHVYSSTIKTRVSARVVETRSGNRYILEGPLDRGRMEFYGFAPAVVDAFESGFPEDWIECLKTAERYVCKAPKTPTPAKQAAGKQNKSTKEENKTKTQQQETHGEGEAEEGREQEEEEEGDEGTVRRSKRKHQLPRPYWVVPAEKATDQRLCFDFTGSGSFQSEYTFSRDENKRPAPGSTERPSKRQKKKPQEQLKPKKRSAESDPEIKPPAKRSGGKIKEDTGQPKKRGRPAGKSAEKGTEEVEPETQENANGTGKGKEKGSGRGQEKATGVKQENVASKTKGKETAKVTKKGASKTPQKDGDDEKEPGKNNKGEAAEKEKRKGAGKNETKETKEKKESDTKQRKQAGVKQEKETGKSKDKAAGKQPVKGARGGKAKEETRSQSEGSYADDNDWGEDEVTRLHQARAVVPMTSRNYWAEVAAVVGTRQPLECYDKIHNTPSNDKPRKVAAKKAPAAKEQQTREEQKEQLLAELASKPIRAGQRSKLVRKLVELEAGQGGDDDILASTPYRDLGPRANPLPNLPVHTLPLTASSHSSVAQSSSPATDSPASATRTDRLITPFGKAGDREGYKASRLGNRKWALVGPKSRGQPADGSGGEAPTKSSRGLTQALSQRGGHMFAQWTEEDERDSGQEDDEEEEEEEE